MLPEFEGPAPVGTPGQILHQGVSDQATTPADADDATVAMAMQGRAVS